ncbi:hypothetical protein FE257_005499, partial [Aspergillus nanangensis]
TGQAVYPADALDEMREWFLLFGTRAPFGWITRLRTYGKKIQNSTTSMGYIYWSDDEQTLSYKELELSMSGFRRFIATQVELAQADLERLFLLHEEEEREQIVPRLVLYELRDDPTNNRWGWNFLQDARTRTALSTTGERWLLDRVLETSWLREEFLELRRIGQDDHVLWREGIVTQYQRDIESFLQRLLLLVHITGGQPGRATELLSLCHSNTKHGRHRNIFIEHGLTQQAVDAVLAAWEQAQAQQAYQPIEPDAIHDANPWLRTIGWAAFLHGIPPADLLRAVETPDPETDDPTSWRAAIRMEAVRTQTDQLPYKLLLPYIDAAAVEKHVRLWQRILAFIARTQQPHTWRSPTYAFTPRQQRQWNELWWLLQRPEAAPKPKGLGGQGLDPFRVIKDLIANTIGRSPPRLRASTTSDELESFPRHRKCAS